MSHDGCDDAMHQPFCFAGCNLNVYLCKLNASSTTDRYIQIMKRTSIFTVAAIVAAGLLSISSAKSPKNDITRQLLIFNNVYKMLHTQYVDTLDATATMRTAIDAMLGSIDPYTEFYSADEQDRLTSVASGEYAGIGSIIMKRDSVIELSQPLWDSPARRSGIRHGDILLAIDNTVLDKNFSTEEASKRLKGKAGTDVTLRIRRRHLPAGSDSILTLTITRGTITTAAVPYYGFVGDGVGYIAITTFSEKTGPDFEAALSQLRKQYGRDLNGLIIDLRNNGGGLLTAAVDVVSNFVPRGTEVVITRGRDKMNSRTYKTLRNPIAPKLPLAVLINNGTASAAEIVSGALQDLDRAVIIGERSYGKGLVQSPVQMPFNSLMKLTTGRYYLPSGRLIQAVDYRHRNADGSEHRIPDSLTTAYATRAGREVRDGGGITPDITNKKPEISMLEYGLARDLYIYDFANRIANCTAQAPDADSWSVSDSLFTEFKSTVDSAKFKYDRPTVTGLDYLRKYADADGLMTDSLKQALDHLEKMMHRDLQGDMDFHKDDIKGMIEDDLSERWFSDSDIIRRNIRDDVDVLTAIDVLCDRTRYDALLAPGTRVGVSAAADNTKESKAGDTDKKISGN